MALEQGLVAELQNTLEASHRATTYETSCRNVDSILANEQARRLRVQAYLLEDERDDLQEELGRCEGRIERLESDVQVTQDAFNQSTKQLENAQHEMRGKAREIETLKAELNSLQSVTMDSTKLLTEKLSLARELSALKPEVDHLRSQASLHQTLLGEKLSLQRQVSTLQVELENEKRPLQRSNAKEDKVREDSTDFKNTIETLRADLDRERKERQRLEKDTRKKCAESEHKVTIVESRLDALRSKLKIAKDQLKETQIEVEQARASAVNAPIPSNEVTLCNRGSRKRQAAKMDESTIIGTPGDFPAGKRNRRNTTTVGEKSTFSITPFLSRTASIAPDSPPSSAWMDSNKENPRSLAQNDVTSTAHVFESSSSKPAKTADRHPSTASSKPLEQKKSSASKPKGLAKILKAPSNLEQVVEEGSEEQRIEPLTAEAPAGKWTDSLYNSPEAVKRTKRRILTGGLAKTLFDEDGDETKGRSLKEFASLNRGGTKLQMLPRKAMSGTNNFGAISPLKKDRRLNGM